MATPKVSVVMCVYNDEDYIREAVDSILNQTFRDFEFIIVNDGSTDRTPEILRSYDDSRIILLDNEKNIGISGSMNRGLKIARGEYIAHLGGDDISLPERLEKQVRFLDENPDIGFISSSAILIDKNGKEIKQSILATEDKELRSRIVERKDTTFWHTSNMIRQEVIRKVGGYREWFRYATDYDLWLRMLEHCNASNIAKPLCKVRIVSNSVSTGKKQEQRGYVNFAVLFAKQRQIHGYDELEKSSGKWFPMRKLNSKLFLDISKQYHTENMEWNPKLSAKYLFKSIINNPLNTDAWIYGMLLAGNKIKNIFLHAQN